MLHTFLPTHLSKSEIKSVWLQVALTAQDLLIYATNIPYNYGCSNPVSLRLALNIMPQCPHATCDFLGVGGRLYPECQLPGICDRSIGMDDLAIVAIRFHVCFNTWGVRSTLGVGRLSSSACLSVCS